MAVKSRFFRTGGDVTHRKVNLKGLKGNRPGSAVYEVSIAGSYREREGSWDCPERCRSGDKFGNYSSGEEADAVTPTRSVPCMGKHPGNRGGDACISNPESNSRCIESPSGIADDIKTPDGSSTEPVHVPCRSKYFVPSARSLEGVPEAIQGVRHLFTERDGKIPRARPIDDGGQGMIRTEASRRPIRNRGKTPRVQETTEVRPTVGRGRVRTTDDGLRREAESETGTPVVPPMAEEEYDPDVDYESRYFGLLERLRPGEPDFVPPRSPHGLLEESLYRDPWALLVSTIFLNVTSCRSARNRIFWFLSDHPVPGSVAGSAPERLERYFEGLGLSRTRATQVWRMSVGYARGGWRRAGELYGIGEYGEAAHRMFCLGDFGFVPGDRYLRIYREWYLRVGRYEER